MQSPRPCVFRMSTRVVIRLPYRPPRASPRPSLGKSRLPNFAESSNTVVEGMNLPKFGLLIGPQISPPLALLSWAAKFRRSQSGM